MPRCLILLLLTIFVPSITSLSLSGSSLLPPNITLPAPLPDSSILKPDITLPPPNTLATCTPFNLWVLRPLYSDCKVAINALSSSGVPGYFHIGGITDAWKLPMHKSVGTCEVSVQLVPFWVVAAGSWQEIKGAVWRLGEECRRIRTWDDVTGGEIKTGTRERILVKMERV